MMLSLDQFDDPHHRAFEAICDTGKELGHAKLVSEIERLGCLSIKASHHASVADHLYSAVIGQQLSLQAASTIRSRVENAAAIRQMPVVELYVPEYEGTLRQCGVSGRKARSLQAIRRAEASGMLSFDELLAMEHSGRLERLCAIWGVGKWTADMISIFHFQDPDIWPEGDVTAVGFFRRHTGVEDTIAGTLPFAPYRSYLARYMWMSKDTNPAPPV